MGNGLEMATNAGFRIVIYDVSEGKLGAAFGMADNLHELIYVRTDLCLRQNKQ